MAEGDKDDGIIGFRFFFFLCLCVGRCVSDMTPVLCMDGVVRSDGRQGVALESRSLTLAMSFLCSPLASTSF